jgi:hypothetical protein
MAAADLPDVDDDQRLIVWFDGLERLNNTSYVNLTPSLATDIAV